MDLNDLFNVKGRDHAEMRRDLDRPEIEAAQSAVAEILGGLPRLAGLWVLANAIGWTAGNLAEDVAPYLNEARDDDHHRESEVDLLGGVEAKAVSILSDLEGRLTDGRDYPAPGRELTPQEISELSRRAFGKGGE